MADRKPTVFACGGCSFAAKLSCDLAKELDRRGIAEMSCLAGVDIDALIHCAVERKCES